MILPWSVRNVSASGMMRLFALLMICVLTMSHGTPGMAAPHVAQSVHSHSHGHHHDAGPGQGAAAHDADESRASDQDESRAIDQDIAHVHSAADMVPGLGDMPAHLVARAIHMRPPPPGPFGSTEPAPLLKPPSA